MWRRESFDRKDEQLQPRRNESKASLKKMTLNTNRTEHTFDSFGIKWGESVDNFRHILLTLQIVIKTYIKYCEQKSPRALRSEAQNETEKNSERDIYKSNVRGFHEFKSKINSFVE